MREISFWVCIFITLSFRLLAGIQKFHMSAVLCFATKGLKLLGLKKTETMWFGGFAIKYESKSFNRRCLEMILDFKGWQPKGFFFF